MKKIFYYTVVPVMLVLSLASCHKLDVEVTTELTAETFPKTEAHYNALMGTIYNLFRDGYTTGHFFVTSQSTDESALLIYGADWIDGNRYQDLHRHTWTKDHPNIGGEWSYLANLIGNTNQILFLLKGSDEGPVKTTSIAEMRTMRALFYFYMMDMFGNVPLDTVYGNTELSD